MELLTGPNTIRKNVQTLMQPAISPARKKAIVTLAKRRNISREDAQFTQARAIARTQSRKK